jgi:hypothetical protein
MTIEITPIEIDVLHYLSVNTDLSYKDILQGVKIIPSTTTVKHILQKLTTMGLLSVKNNVLYSLSKLGRCLIGASHPTDFLHKELLRRGFPAPPLTRVNDYDWGRRVEGFTSVATGIRTNVSPINRLLTTPPRKKDDTDNLPWGIVPSQSSKVTVISSTKPSEVMHISVDKLPPADKEDKIQKPVIEKDFEPHTKQPLTSKKEAGNMSDINSNVMYFFSENERALLSKIASGDVCKYQPETNSAVKTLAARLFISEGDNENCVLAPLGKLALSKQSLLPFTQQLDLSREERIFFEVITRGDPFMLRVSYAQELLAAHSLPSSKKDVKRIIGGLKDKGLMLTRSNKMSYFTAGAIGLAGLNKTTPRVLKDMMAIPGVAEDYVNAIKNTEQTVMLNIALSFQAKKAVKKAPAPSVEVIKLEKVSQNELQLNDDTVSKKTKGPSPSPTDKVTEVHKTTTLGDALLAEIEAKRIKLSTPELPPVEIESKAEKIAFLEGISASFFPESNSKAAALLKQIVDDYGKF